MADVKIISDTIQEFDGERFYLCGYYFQHKGRRLHRAVWEHYNGPIPEGYHIHHIDEDRSNNEIENLALMPGIEHMTSHARTESRRENGRMAIKIAIIMAPEWHSSEDGKKWHSEHAKAFWENREPHTNTCDNCGKEYETRCTRIRGNHFCCNNCKAAHYRRRSREKRSGYENNEH